jgi:hypothetical protein
MLKSIWLVLKNLLGFYDKAESFILSGDNSQAVALNLWRAGFLLSIPMVLTSVHGTVIRIIITKSIAESCRKIAANFKVSLFDDNTIYWGTRGTPIIPKDHISQFIQV